MHVFQRPQVHLLRQRLAEPPRHLITIFGPRQTGKTTIVQQALAQVDVQHRYCAVDVRDDPASDVQFDIHETHLPISGERDSDWLVRTWNQARVRATRSKNGFVLVLDEIQKIPKWSDTVKGLWDTDRARGCPLHVILLGSAPLLMQSGLSESLAGRFEPVQVTHWSFPEMSQAFDFDLQQYIYFGGYPGCAGFIDDQERWRNYILEALIKSNIERDVLAMTRVDKPALLKRFFDLGSDYSGQILSYTKMVARLESAGNTTTLARYLDLLTDAGLLTGLQGYSNRPVQRRTSSPKLNVLNTALMTAGSGYDFHQAVADRTFWGRIVESAVGAHLFNSATSDISIHYWRDRGHEVDFVLKRGPRIVGIEVKSAARKRPSQGMLEFQKRCSPWKSLVVGDGGVQLSELLSVPTRDWFEVA